MSATPPPTATEDLLRELAPQVLGALVRRYGHFDAAEDAVQESLLAASVQWTEQGLPANPAAWLTTVATRRLIDQLRGDDARRRREETDVVRSEPARRRRRRTVTTTTRSPCSSCAAIRRSRRRRSWR